MHSIARLLRYVGRYCFRMSNKLYSFADEPYIRIGNMYFFFHSTPAIGVLKPSEDNFLSIYAGFVEIMILDDFGGEYNHGEKEK